MKIDILTSFDDYKQQAKSLKSVAFARFKNASSRREWDAFTKQSHKSKNDIKRELQQDLEFLNQLCMSDGHPSMFKQEEDVVIPDLSWEE